MLVNSTSFKLLLLGACVCLTSAQNDPIRDNIEYNRFFMNLRGQNPVSQPTIRNKISSAPSHINIPIPTQESSGVVRQNSVENDPFLKELFEEFVAQYKQLEVEESHVRVPVTTTTSLPRTAPIFAHQPKLEPSYIPTPSIVQPQHQPRVQIRRRKPVTVTTQSTVVKDTVDHKEALRQKYFGIKTPKNDEIKSSDEQQNRRNTFFSVKPSTSPPEQVKTVGEQHTKLDVSETTNAPNSKALFNSRFSKPVQQKTNEKPTASRSDSKFDESEFRRQAESAKYAFTSQIDDNINGQTNEREEVRDGLAVKGRYSFSDGYFMRTVHYEADEKGYRVVKEEVIPLDGPEYNPDGDARVSTFVDGNKNDYQITTDDIQKKKQKHFAFEPIEDDDEEYQQRRV